MEKGKGGRACRAVQRRISDIVRLPFRVISVRARSGYGFTNNLCARASAPCPKAATYYRKGEFSSTWNFLCSLYFCS